MNTPVKSLGRPQDRPSENLCRRRLVTAMGSLAAAAAALPALAASAEPADPIFDLIDAHRLARARYDAARDAAEALDQSLPDDVMRGPRAKVGSFRHEDGRETPRYLYSHAEIKAEAAELLALGRHDRSEVRQWQKRNHAEFQADVVRRQRLQNEAGLTAARAAEQEADDAEAAAIDTLCTVPPTTIAGNLALIRYMLVYDRKYIDDFDGTEPGYRIAVAVERSLSLMSA